MPTNIEWTEETWNPVTGCSKVSPGCDNCYALRMSNRLRSHDYYRDLVKDGEWVGLVRTHPATLPIPKHWREPRRVFVCSMSDLFHSAVPWHFIGEVFRVMAECPRHTFQVLTKRPGRMAHFANEILGPDNWPRNVWAGTSVESAKYLPRLDVLARVPALVRFVSLEPLLSPVDLTRWTWCATCREPDGDIVCGEGGRVDSPQHGPDIHWVIAGGESGPGARPMHPDWARAIRDQCQVAGVPFFFKQQTVNGKRVSLPLLNGRRYAEMPVTLP